MNKRWLFQGIPLILIIGLIVAGFYLTRKNEQCNKQNNGLLLQNDSILSVNIMLKKEVARMQTAIDSLQSLSVKK
ncbi:MAG: hypothetical protein P0Y53_06935 [Candidatus Pseudobacter hemicellulosilyticus]|uniref:Uncharacterized protein n=1 Tax=Candidatus Pseudobacter hemicellulosilyticus TaxID=3121375 RepID=A0AAJ5WZF3_9BACT|nr:MAG: hypothetical protein P0Y53_06935 [Pseudobacter sp.]